MMENIILSGLSFRNSFGDFHFKQYTTPSPLTRISSRDSRRLVRWAKDDLQTSNFLLFEMLKISTPLNKDLVPLSNDVEGIAANDASSMLTLH
jgi:hypothetical protein